MISIAILAILLAAPISLRNGTHFLASERAWRDDLRSARFQIDALRDRPFDELPPRVARVGDDGRVDLGDVAVVPGTVHLRDTRGADIGGAEIDASHLRLAPDQAGRTILVDFSFYAPEVGECHTVAAGRPPSVMLEAAPVARVLRVLVAEGEHLAVLPPSAWSVEGENGRLSLPPSAAGHVVRVDYLPRHPRMAVHGRFLDDSFRPCPGEGPIRQIWLEPTERRDVDRLRLQMLEVRG
jgi:hypothetical protein